MATGHAERGIVRILAARPGRPTPVGAGFLISGRHVLTCAHVVNESLGLREFAPDRPEVPIFMDLPAPGRPGPPVHEDAGANTQGPINAQVIAWHPAREQPRQGRPDDIAVLELREPCDVEAALPLVRPDKSVRPAYRGYAYGFPARGDDGIWAKGELSGHQHFGWRQIDDVEADNAIDAGFSGCPFLDAAQERVIGLVVARHNRFPVSYLIPVETLLQAWGELARIARQEDLPEPAEPGSSSHAAATAKAEQQQSLNVSVNIFPGSEAPASVSAAPPAAPDAGTEPAAAADDGLPTVTLRVDCTAGVLNVNALRPITTPVHTTDIADLQRSLGDKDHGALFRALFASPHQLVDLLTAPGGSARDADPRDQPLRLRLLCTDLEAATLPWHCLTHNDERLGESGWIVELVDEPDGGLLPIALDNPLIVAPSDPGLALKIGARPHAAEVRAHIRRLLAERRAPVQWVSGRRELEIALEKEPDLIYVFAQLSADGGLIIGRDAGHPERCSLDDLLPHPKPHGSKPLLWLHLVEGRGAELDRAALLALRARVHLLLVQTTTRANLERSLNNTLDWMAAMADAKEEPAAVISRLGDHRGVHLWLGSRSLRLCATSDADAALIDSIRASLIRILLGRKTEKLLLFDGVKRSPSGSLSLYGVCGDEQACVHDLPEQARQFIEELDEAIQVETRPIPFRMHAGGEDLFDDVARQLKQDLNISLAFPPEEALRRIPVVPPEGEDTLVIALSWLLEPDADFPPEGIGAWIATWKQAILEVLNQDEIPAGYRLLVGACIQWSENWRRRQGGDAATVQRQVNQALRRDNPRAYVRSIEIERPLGQLQEHDLIEFYEDLDPELRARLGVRNLNLDDLAAYILTETEGQFQETVQLIYAEYKHHYTGYNEHLKGKKA